MTRSVESIIAAIKRLPAAKVEIDDARGFAQVRVGAALIARIDFGPDTVLVSAPADWIATFERAFPSARRNEDGIVFDLADAQGCSEALAAIRRRVDVQRFVPQFRAASP